MPVVSSKSMVLLAETGMERKKKREPGWFWARPEGGSGWLLPQHPPLPRFLGSFRKIGSRHKGPHKETVLVGCAGAAREGGGSSKGRSLTAED